MTAKEACEEDPHGLAFRQDKVGEFFWREEDKDGHWYPTGEKRAKPLSQGAAYHYNDWISRERFKGTL